jgi:hypothetical protein
VTKPCPLPHSRVTKPLAVELASRHTPQQTKMPYPYVGDVDFSQVQFAPSLVSDSSTKRKSVETFLDGTSTRRSNHIKFQACRDETEPMEAHWSLDAVFDDSKDASRRTQTVRLTNEKTLEALRALDERVVQEAVSRSKEWWKVELNEDQVRLRYNPLVQTKDGQPIFKFKVKCTGAAVPTKIMRVVSENEVVPDTERVLETAGAKMVPLVSTMGLYFLGDKGFGLSFQAEELLVTPGEEKQAMSNFALSKPLSLKRAAPEERGGEDDVEVPNKCVKVELEDDEGESAM